MGDRSVHARDVSQSVVVTGDGNQVRLTFGDTGVALPLRRPWSRPTEQRRRRPAAHGSECLRELDILVPEAGKLPLVGREDLLSDLRAWLDDERDISVLALTGRAGTGKTRLALEFCRTVDGGRDAGEGAWIAGFVSSADLTEVVRAYATRSFAWERRTLLVLDYAARCSTVLARWLDRLADLDPLAAKLRLLLLEREVSESSGWWHELTAPAANSERARLDLFHELRPWFLPDLAAVGERRRVMAAALQAARAFRPEAPRVEEMPVPGEDPAFDRHLAQPQFGNPLSLVMAGVIAAERGPQAALALRRLDAARRLGERELKRLTDLAASRGIEAGAMRHAVAFNGLSGGLPLANLRRTLADELAAAQRLNRLDDLVLLLKQELPARDEAGAAAQKRNLATIQPDLIGEAAIIKAFKETPSLEEAPAIVRRAYALDKENAAQALVRLVQDYAYALEDTAASADEKKDGQQVLDWLGALSDGIADPEHLIPLVWALPEHTTILRKPAVKLTARLAEFFYRQAKQGDPLAVYYAAMWTDSLATRLAALGRFRAALEVGEDAVRLRRALAKIYGDALAPALADSLNNVANLLDEMDQPGAALEKIEEAVQIRRALAKAHPSVLAPDLAHSLSNRARLLAKLDQPEAALDAAEEAMRLIRPLAEARPDAFTPDLASALIDLAFHSAALDRSEAAFDAAEEAVRLYRPLAEARPDAFTPDLARSLWVLGDRHVEAGQPEHALAALQEGLERLAPAFETMPAAFGGVMAGLERSYGSVCQALGREPDRALLAPVLEVFMQLKHEEGEEMTSHGNNRSVNVGGNINDSSVVPGNNNTVITRTTHHPLPPPETVNVTKELAALRDLLSKLNVPELGKLERAMEDAKEEAAKPKPDKDEVAGALGRVVKYAKDADDFSQHAEKLMPRIAALGAWLGTHGQALLTMAGIAV